MKLIRATLVVLLLAISSFTQSDSADIPIGEALPEEPLAEDMPLRNVIEASWCSGQTGCERALETANNEAKEQPDSAKAHYKLGLAYFKYGHTGNWQQGVEAFQKAIQIEPNYAEAYCKLGEAYDLIHYHALKSEHPMEEREAFQKAIDIRPDLAEAYIQLGKSYLLDNGSVGDCKRAEALFTKAVQVSPEYEEAYHALASAYQYQDREREALEVSKKAVLVNPHKSESYYRFYNFTSYKGYAEDAIETFKEAIKLKPNNVPAYRCLGMIYYHQSRYDEAIQAYKKLLRIAPHFAEAQYELGATYLTIGDKKSAIAQYRILEKLSKKAWASPSRQFLYQRRAKGLLSEIKAGKTGFSHYGSCTP